MKLSVRGSGPGGAIVVETDENDEPFLVSRELNGYSALQELAAWFNARTDKLEAEAAKLDAQAGAAAAKRASKPPKDAA